MKKILTPKNSSNIKTFFEPPYFLTLCSGKSSMYYPIQKENKQRLQNKKID